MPKTHALKHLVFWILGLAIAWGGFSLGRSFWYHPWCAVQPSPCQMDLVNVFDQISFQNHSIFADFLSNILQNSTAVVMLILPWIFLKKSRTSPIITTLFLLLGTTVNGFFLELVHGLVQRPRPLVFRDPMGDGAHLAQYTSFYSGHTSFVAFATLSTFLWIKRLMPEKKPLQSVAFTSYLGLTALTGTLRILGGRHFPTDVLCGWVAGTLVALLVYHWMRFDFDEISKNNDTFSQSDRA